MQSQPEYDLVCFCVNARSQKDKDICRLSTGVQPSLPLADRCRDLTDSLKKGEQAAFYNVVFAPNHSHLRRMTFNNPDRPASGWNTAVYNGQFSREGIAASMTPEERRAMIQRYEVSCAVESIAVECSQSDLLVCPAFAFRTSTRRATVSSSMASTTELPSLEECSAPSA